MEKIKLFVKKNTEEKKDDRKLIEKIGDWFNDDDNLPLVTYGIGIGVGLGCGYLLGHTFGKSAQAAKDAKEYDLLLASLGEYLDEVGRKYIDFSRPIKIDALRTPGGRPCLRFTGMNIYDKQIVQEVASCVENGKALADDLNKICQVSELEQEISVALSNPKALNVTQF